MNTTFFSRERAAGYDPEVLTMQPCLLVGAGALGQNILMELGTQPSGQDLPRRL
jgi:hypothetical protein